LLPAEWSPQQAILMCWPHESMNWQSILHEVEVVFDEIAYYICQGQQLIIIAHDKHHQNAIQKRLADNNISLNKVSWLIHPNNDNWCRDFGPITVLTDHSPLTLDFTFNGWGEKYPYQYDNSTNQQLKSNDLIKAKLKTIDMVLEGGSIDSDGMGTLLTTEACLLSEKRNPELNKHQIENKLVECLGAKRVLWLKHGFIEGDDTDSHIDNLARFCDENTIAYACCNDKNDTHYQSLQDLESELKQLKTLDGHAYKLIPLNLPQAIYDQEQRLPASYVNFLITNQFVLMPTFDDQQDNINLEKLQSVFIDRKVIAINSSSLIKQLGSIHCLTMQIPAPLAANI
ncbi:MAG: agmatine deiminase family protein, partial [Gammaproteobacteria bacterium]|nr:agmatine deiminase family protein [Gammaproteobacteria bacterium]